jgi:hypothetical protein
MFSQNVGLITKFTIMMIADIAPRLLKSEPYKAIHVQMIARGAINNTPAKVILPDRPPLAAMSGREFEFSGFSYRRQTKKKIRNSMF